MPSPAGCGGLAAACASLWAGWVLGMLAAVFSARGLPLPNCNAQTGCGPALHTIRIVAELKAELQAPRVWLWEGRLRGLGQNCP